MRKITFFMLAIFILGAFKPKPAYQIFSGEKSKSINFDKMMKSMKDADVVFFGESHNNSICHWLQLQVLKSLAETTGKNVVVGAEMFEADDQLVLTEYVNGIIKEEHFKREAKIWDNYKTDYAPIVNFAKAQNYSFIATNIPRRYARLVARSGLGALDKLDKEAKKYMAPLPIVVDYKLPGYVEMAKMMAGHSVHSIGGAKNMIAAQAIKDATMAYFIHENLSDEKVIFHINGTLHSKNKEGIVHYLKKYRPGLKIVTITTVEQDEIYELNEENKSLADFIIAIPEDMTRTF